MIVQWTDSAKLDRHEIYEHIAEFDQLAADNMDFRFERASRQLAEFPLSARSGDIPGTRELIPHPNYRLIYKVEDNVVLILALLHTRRQWPPEPGE